MLEYLPVLIAIASLVGSVLTFFLTSRERAAKEALTRANAAHKNTESWAKLVQALQTQVDELQKDVGRIQTNLDREQKLRRALETQLSFEQEARRKAEEKVDKLAKRVDALEQENAYLRAENADLREQIKSQ